jgi:hypothetical protein
MKPGEIYSPRRHGQHYHVETRLDSSISWNNKKKCYLNLKIIHQDQEPDLFPVNYSLEFKGYKYGWKIC